MSGVLSNEESTIREALQHHQRGNVLDAQKLYNKVLNVNPQNANALNLLGVIATTQGQHQEALAYFDRALSAVPSLVSAHYNKGNVLDQLGRIEEAAESYRATLQIQPDHIDALQNLGVLEYARGNFPDAKKILSELVRRSPQAASARFNLGSACLALKDLDGAEFELRQAIALQPNYHEALGTLALVCEKKGDVEAGLASILQALKIAPQSAMYQNTRGLLLLRAGDQENAIQAFKLAIELEPQAVLYRSNLGAALIGRGHALAAVELLEQVCQGDLKNSEALFNLASAFDDVGDIANAIVAYEKALVIDPKYAEAHQCLAMLMQSLGYKTASEIHQAQAQLLAPQDPFLRFSAAGFEFARGNLERAWQCLESRFDMWAEARYRSKAVQRHIEPPVYWRGEPLEGKLILVWAEQGIGDEVLYASMLPDLSKRGARVVLACAGRLVPVFTRAFANIQVIAADELVLNHQIISSLDFQIAIGSLGLYLRTRLDSFPRHIGYLKSDISHTAQLKLRYGQGPLIGVSWRSQAGRVGVKKTLKLNDLAPVLSITGATFVNLQYGDCAEEIAEVCQGPTQEILTDASIDPLRDLDAFFAQVAAMDLVITTSNTTAHVAGALGVPTWLILPQGAGALWYWCHDSDESIWYPSVKIFRGPARLDSNHRWWSKPVADVAMALQAWIANTQAK